MALDNQKWFQFLTDLKSDILPIYKKNEDKFDSQSVHGRIHICRALIFAEYMSRFIHKTVWIEPDYNAIRYAVAFHDSGRQGGGKDLWEKDSSNICYNYLQDKYEDQKYNKYVSQLFLKKGDYQDFNKRIVYDSDVLEIMRPSCGAGGIKAFRKELFLFLGEKDFLIAHLHNSPEVISKFENMRKKLIHESWEWIYETEKQKNSFNQADDIFREILQYLLKSNDKYPLLSSVFSEDDLISIDENVDDLLSGLDNYSTPEIDSDREQLVISKIDPAKTLVGSGDEIIETTAQLLKEAKHVVMLTGAGVSTESGIPDYRGDTGIRSNPEKATELLKPILEKQKKLKYPKGTLEHPLANMIFGYDYLLFFKPNKAHFSMVALELMGKLKYLVTQNGDNLHARSGFPKSKLGEIHGNCFILKCKRCETYFDLLPIRQKVLNDTSYIPVCSSCDGKLTSSIVDFGDPIPMDVWQRAQEETKKCDVFFTVGTSLNVFPIANLVTLAKKNNAKVVMINLGEAQMDHYVDIVIQMKAGEALPKIVRRLNNLLKA